MPTTAEKPKWIKDLGGYNTMPEPYAECTASDFYWQLSIYGFGQRTEHRQVPLKVFGDRTVHHSVHIIWYHDVAYAIVTYQANSNWDSPDHYQAKFFRIGCKHTYRELSVGECHRRGINHFGNCYHVNRCTKCGTIETIDSSG